MESQTSSNAVKASTNDSNVIEIMKTSGYENCSKIASTLQGSIWRAIQSSTRKKVVIKVTDRNLHKNQLVVISGQKIKVHENIKKEGAILKYLTEDPECPQSVIKRIAAFKSNANYFLVMEDGGCCLFDFVVRVHHFINTGVLEIAEWHKLVKIIFAQMIECLAYIHSKNITHFDVSLENFLINDIDVAVDQNKKITFCIEGEDAVQIKLCDFGLSEVFTSNEPNTRFESDKHCGKPNYYSPEISSKKKRFSASSNDIWCLGTCLFMMIVGTAPWNKTTETDERFKHIMDGDLTALLSAWGRPHYVDKHILRLFSSIFQYEDNRANIKKLQKCSWLKSRKQTLNLKLMSCIKSAN